MAFFPTIKETFLELTFGFISLYHYLKKKMEKNSAESNSTYYMRGVRAHGNS